ncbi:hypothetical protein OIU78_000853 [Salix suchowensis]|nr:hypothetical protein OIU78_000853 [Salix suchowensis]
MSLWNTRKGFFYSNAEQREAMVAAERRQVDERVRKIIELKDKVCSGTDNNFVVINQKGIDPPSLDLLARAGGEHSRDNIVGINLQTCGTLDPQMEGIFDNYSGEHSRDNIVGINLQTCGTLDPQMEGIFDNYSVKRQLLNSGDGLVYEHVLGEEKYTFVENVKNPHSCTILIKGPNDHTIAQIKDAVRDGLRAVKNTIEDEAVVLGAGAFELAARKHLINAVKKTVKGVNACLFSIFE